MDPKILPMGRGKVLFRKSGTTGFHDFGELDDMTVTIETEKQQKYSTRTPVKTLIDERVTSITATFKFTSASFSKKNLELFNLGTGTEVTQASGTLSSVAITVSDKELWFDIGKKDLSNVVVKDETDAVTYVENTDYELDAAAGMIYVLPEGGISAGDVIHVSADYAEVKTTEVSAAVTGTIDGTLKFISNNPGGTKMDFEGDVSLTPAGDLALISDDYMSMPFEGSIKNSETGQYLYKLYLQS